MAHEKGSTHNHNGRSSFPVYQSSLALFVAAILVTPMLLLLSPADAQRTSGGRLDDAEFKLLVTPLPPTLPADGNSYNILIQLLTAGDDKPAESPYDIEINILTSDPSVISVPFGTLTMEEGE